MRGLRYLALSLACAAGAGPIMAAAADQAPPPAPAATAAAATPADTAPALIAFQRDLISVLAPQADALPLLAAALLARPLPSQPKYNDFHTLIERSAKADDAGAAVSWVRLTDCDVKADTCPNASALGKLTAQAPDNAAVWLFKLGLDSRDNKKDAARQDLAKAAAAKLYDDYTGISLKALSSNISLLPPPAATVPAGAAAGASGVQMMIVFGTADTQPQPSLQATAQLCQDGAGDDAVKDDCLKLGKILEWGSSPLARSLGLHLREVLAADPTQQEDAKRARRDLVWQVQSFAELSARAQGDKGLAQHLLALARSGGTEMSLMLAALRDYGMPAEAPADWQPAHPQS